MEEEQFYAFHILIHQLKFELDLHRKEGKIFNSSNASWEHTLCMLGYIGTATIHNHSHNEVM